MNEVIQPEVEASATLIRHTLALLGLPKERAIAYLERFRGAMLTGRAADGAERAEDGAERAADGAEPTELPHVEEVRLAPGEFADESLREAKIRERFGVTVVAVTRAEGVVFNPAPETVLRAGDVLRVFGLAAQIADFAAQARAGRRGLDGHGRRS